MSAVSFDRVAVEAAIDQVATRLLTMATTARDTTRVVPATPQWTVADALAHVATVVPRYSQGARHEGEWVAAAHDLADLNARQLTTLSTRDVTILAKRIRASLVELTRVVQGFGHNQPVFTFHGGQRVAADVALGVLLGEFVVHGHDIAGALHREWPVDPAHVELIMQGLTPILPGWLDPGRARGHTARYELRLRGQGTHRFEFDDGRLTMNPSGRFRPDVVISTDPAAFLLITYKRANQWPAILSGRVTGWGRRPWLALSFAGRFHTP